MPVMIDNLSSNVAAASAEINGQIATLESEIRQSKNPVEIQKKRQRLEQLLTIRTNIQKIVQEEVVRLR